MTARDLIKRLATPLRDPRLTDLFAISRRRRRTMDDVDAPTFLIAPTGGGNIGDEAMVEAYLERVEGPVVLVTRSRAAFARQAGRPGVTVLESPHLLHRGYFPFTLLEARRLRRAWTKARAVAVIGADIMDGAYIWQNSVTRANIARWAADSGLDSRILGFSWNENPHPRAAAAVRRAGDAGVRLFARDPHSRDRLVAQQVDAVELAADTVFAAEATDDDVFRRIGVEDLATPMVIVNVSGLVGRQVEQGEPTSHVVSRLVAAGLHVILLPHVIREAKDDADAVIDVFHRLSSDVREHTTLVTELLSPAEIRSLSARARMVVTGRMHLSIIALSSGVPAVVVATQGKVSGLMEMFGTDELLVEPRSIPTGDLERAVEATLSLLDPLRAQVADRLPAVISSAQRNFDGLHGPSSADEAIPKGTEGRG